ncbi:MAG: hypothetical protein M3336_17430 [Chloroflexota bacterium]|nr:hypothetical protein [Chloroflexota bacterium]
MSARVAIYTSGHGFGHAVRCAEVAAALLRRGAQVLVRTDAPAWLFPAQVRHLAGQSVDVGVTQHDGFEMDIDETRRRWADFADVFDERASREAALLREQRVDLVLGDVPPLAFAAAARVGVPGVALANFGWDWIYAAWPGFESAIACVQAAYRLTELLLRLPLHDPGEEAFPAFRAIEDVPLVARRAARPRQQVRRELGLSDEQRVVLLSFGGFEAGGLDLAALSRWREYLFIITPPLARSAGLLPPNVRRVPEQPSDYVSLLAASDVVVTKPGYGIVADALANRVPVLFTDRGPFREYEVLANALLTLGPARYVPRADVLSGWLGPSLAALSALPRRWADLRVDGADLVADRVIGLVTHGAQGRTVRQNVA